VASGHMTPRKVQNHVSAAASHQSETPEPPFPVPPAGERCQGFNIGLEFCPCMVGHPLPHACAVCDEDHPAYRCPHLIALYARMAARTKADPGIQRSISESPTGASSVSAAAPPPPHSPGAVHLPTGA